MIVVYVSNAKSGDISVLQLDPLHGTLTPVQRIEVGGEVMPLALSPNRRHLYAARRSEPREALSFEIDPGSGTLRRIGTATLPHSMAFIATDRSGRFLLSASYGGNQIAVSPIHHDGIVRPAQQVLPTGPHAHAIQSDPSNRFVFATSLGAGVITQWRFDAATGEIAPHTPMTLQPHVGASPRHLVFSPDARFVYLLGELDAAIDVLAFDADAGTLRTVQTIGSLPPGFSGEPWAADLHLTPDGRFLYTSERRSSTLAVWRVNADSGTLALIGHLPTEAQPRGFNVTPDGGFLVAAGQRSHHVTLYRIQPETGWPDELGRCAVGEGPNWVESVALDH